MPYFLSDKNLSLHEKIEIAGEEARHILLAHRIKQGEKIKVQGPDGKRYLVEITEINRNKLSVMPQEEIKAPQEPLVAITLFQSIVSEKALDFIFQKSTELGVSKIVLFNSQNTATKLSADKFKSKQERWNKILIEAAKQCERQKSPGLEFLPNVDRVILTTEKIDKVYLADINSNKLSILKNKPTSVALIIGPEGGFTGEEVSKFKTLSNIELISFGPILLRAETAALAGLATINLIV